MKIHPPEETSEKFGRLAFAYCKIATVSLLLGRFALPVAAVLSAGFFVAGWFRGKKDTRCALRSPLLAAGLWGVVLAVWLGCEFAPRVMPSWLGWLHR
ncbi:MAG: hypothetical protein K8R88_08030 [Armatimonadetes bacterium]|nr:hypothetical protein [Armatimonadota bacterium]